MPRAVFLDRDGVINEDTGFPHKIEDLCLLPGVIEALQQLQCMGFLLFFVTNQSGIGRGYYSVADFNRFNNEIIQRLAKHGIRIEKTYFCPHHPEDKCECRKPGIVNLKKAEAAYGVSLSDSYVIGDRQNDIDLARGAGCRAVGVLTGDSNRNGPVTDADHVAENILEAVKWIEHVEQKKSDDPRQADACE